MDITKALEGVEVNEEQAKSITEFMTAFAEDIRAKTVASAGAINEEEIVKHEQEKFSSEKEKMIAEHKEELKAFESKTREAFDLFYEDSKQAFEAGKESLQLEYTENMAKALGDLYEEIQERVKKDFFESTEFKTLDEIKKIVAPIITDKEKKAVMEEVEALKAEKKTMLVEREELERKKIMSTLLEDFPEEHRKTVETFCEKAETTDELYDRFNAIVEMLQTDIMAAAPVTPSKSDDSKPRFAKKPKTVTPVQEGLEPEIEDKKTANPVFESAPSSVKAQPKTKWDKASELFSDSEKQYLGIMFGGLNAHK